MNKLWTPEQRLEAINKIAYLGNLQSSPIYYWMIGMLTNGKVEELNTSKDIAYALDEACKIKK